MMEAKQSTSLLWDLRFREMTLEDVDQVWEIESQTFSTPWSAGFFRQSIASSYLCRVLENEGRIEAYSVLSLSGPTGHLLNLCVRSQSRGRGLGRELLSRMIELCRGKVAMLLLEVRPSNLVAIELYQSFGFRAMGIRPEYYRDQEGKEDALVMSLRL